jgi:ribosomal protein S18 acetylase RimI-like enzyme
VRQPRLRSMTEADLEPVVAAILADEWGDRHAWFGFAMRNPAARVLVAEDDEGRAIGTGVLSIHGSVGWVGTIWIASGYRRQGLGRALTAATVELGEAAGCRTFLLVATSSGRPLYEGLGFEVQTWYRTMEAPSLGAGHRAGPNADFDDVASRLRAYRPEDLTEMADLDRAATGEDRSAALALLANPEASRIVERDGRVVAFLTRAPWGGGATIAPHREDALELIEARRRAAAPDRRVRCGILLENEVGAEALEARGWTEAWRAPRLIRGEPLDWHPDWIWGQFNHAMG